MYRLWLLPWDDTRILSPWLSGVVAVVMVITGGVGCVSGSGCNGGEEAME